MGYWRFNFYWPVATRPSSRKTKCRALPPHRMLRPQGSDFKFREILRQSSPGASGGLVLNKIFYYKMESLVGKIKSKRFLTPEQIKERQAKNNTLVIEYSDMVPHYRKFEGIRGVSDPSKVLSRRNATMIKSVTYRGVPYDFSKHLAAYPIKVKKEDKKHGI